MLRRILKIRMLPTPGIEGYRRDEIWVRRFQTVLPRGGGCLGDT